MIRRWTVHIRRRHITQFSVFVYPQLYGFVFVPFIVGRRPWRRRDYRVIINTIIFMTASSLYGGGLNWSVFYCLSRERHIFQSVLLPKHCHKTSSFSLTILPQFSLLPNVTLPSTNFCLNLKEKNLGK